MNLNFLYVSYQFPPHNLDPGDDDQTACSLRVVGVVTEMQLVSITSVGASILVLIGALRHFPGCRVTADAVF